MRKLILIAIALLFLQPAFCLEITEIMYNPIEDENYNEYVEIYNDEEEDVNVTLLTLCNDTLFCGYVSKSGENFSSECILKKGEFALITDGGSGSEVFENFDVKTEFLFYTEKSSICGRLANSGEEVTLEKNSEKIAFLYYDGSCEEGESFSGECEEPSPGYFAEEVSEEFEATEDSVEKENISEEKLVEEFSEKSASEEIKSSKTAALLEKEEFRTFDEIAESEIVYCSDSYKTKYYFLIGFLGLSALMNIFLLFVLMHNN